MLVNTHINNKSVKKAIIWGGTGGGRQAKALLDMLDINTVAIFDDTPGMVSPFSGVPIYRGFDAFQGWYSGQGDRKIGFVITFGNPHGRIRLSLHNRLKTAGLFPLTLVHSDSIVAQNAEIGEGSLILAGANVDVDVRIGKQCIIGLNSVVSHEDNIGDGCEIGPGAIICGDVTIGENTWVAAGATVLPRIKIGNDVLVGAGSLVTKDIPDKVTVFGNPAVILPVSKEKRDG